MALDRRVAAVDVIVAATRAVRHQGLGALDCVDIYIEDTRSRVLCWKISAGRGNRIHQLEDRLISWAAVTDTDVTCC
jgi:hypothetical protein